MRVVVPFRISYFEGMEMQSRPAAHGQRNWVENAFSYSAS